MDSNRVLELAQVRHGRTHGQGWKVCVSVGYHAVPPNEGCVNCCHARLKVDYGSGVGVLAHAGCGRMCGLGELWKWASVGLGHQQGSNRFRALTLRLIQARAVALAVPSVLSMHALLPSPTTRCVGARLPVGVFSSAGRLAGAQNRGCATEPVESRPGNDR